MCDEAKATEMHIKSVYHSADSILRTLNSERVISSYEVGFLLNCFNQTFPDGMVNFSKSPRKELFIVFEGLDGSGKSTIARTVAKICKGVKLATPPKSVSAVRKLFDRYEPLIRKAYYSLGNYIAAKEIETICEEKPVFLDRFWHSTAAYAIAQAYEHSSALPPAGDPIYKWPEDLLKPDLVLFLDVNEETRRERHERRAQTTQEEEQLAKDEAFRNLVLAAYNNMDDIPVVHVDSSCSVRPTVTDCLQHIKKLTPSQTAQDL